MLLSGCGSNGGGTAVLIGAPGNTGGGYTLKASGGTVNDGSGANGLAILATLRDEQGWGPALPWTIEITGPGLASPLSLDYQDGRPGSFMFWEWAGFDPLSGAYRATATNFDGSVTIHYDFKISAASTLARPAPYTSMSGDDTILSWPAVPGAKSYTYEVFPFGGGEPLFDCITSTSANLGALANGDYLVLVRAYSADFLSLDASRSSSPPLPQYANVSDYVFTFPAGGDQTSTSYSLNAAGGIIDFGYRGPGSTPIYGLAVWTSILYGTPNPNSAPAGDWNVRITDPNGRIINFIYPAGEEHYAYWYYGIEPVIGTYTVTATYGSASRTAIFSLQDLTPALTLPTQLSASKLGNDDISITWDAVPEANSYYVSLWADIWNNSTKTYEFTEVFGEWVSTNGDTIANGALPSGLTCYAYVTAYQVNMASTTPPGTLPSRADMSENYYGYQFPFLTP